MFAPEFHNARIIDDLLTMRRPKLYTSHVSIKESLFVILRM